MDKIYKNAIKIIKILKKNGFKCYFAGGAVRDRILGKAYQDIDIASSAKPEDIKNLFRKTLHIGAQFGVSVVIIDNICFEVTSFRKDLNYIDGRHPQKIIFSDEKEDALRRDFTINGLFFDPLKNKLIDYVQGKKDIQSKIIRCIGNPYKRFDEDKLRILRAIRFSVQLQYRIHIKTWSAIQCYHKSILSVSYERIRDEIFKIYHSHDPHRAFLLLYKSGLFEVIFYCFSGFFKNKDNFNLFYSFFKKFNLKKRPFSQFESIFLIASRFFCMKTILENLTKLKVCKKQKKEILSLIVLQKSLDDFLNESKANQLRLLMEKDFYKAFCFHRYYFKILKKPNKKLYSFIKNLYDQEKDFIRNFESPIKGKDLIQLGIRPDKIFKDILFTAENQFLEKKILDKKSLLKWISNQFLKN